MEEVIHNADKIIFSIAALVGAVAGLIFVSSIIKKGATKSLKGKIAGQELEWTGESVTPEMIRKQIKTSLYISRRIEEVRRDITIEQKHLAKPIKPMFINILKQAGGGDADDLIYQLAWREFLDTLHRSAEQNHILQQFKGGQIDEEYMDRKLLEAQLDYRTGPAMPSWFDIADQVKDLIFKFLCRARDISLVHNFKLLDELKELREINEQLDVVREIIDEEISRIKTLLEE